eukprot:TRINITY_DN15474_c0_g1_i1.p1 TRINITY_DN15474_c0_g1~~TRINITY_DN15474_c0_g1_i1.p1  ORF type:complete len:349 (-),score=96.97 TRINITY_DN15474_c0_g1_i1:20-1066(-)
MVWLYIEKKLFFLPTFAIYILKFLIFITFLIFNGLPRKVIIKARTNLNIQNIRDVWHFPLLVKVTKFIGMKRLKVYREINVPNDGKFDFKNTRVIIVAAQELKDCSKEGYIIHIHGGGWCAFNPEFYLSNLAQISKETGMAIFSIDYKLAPEQAYPSQPNEVAFCIEWIKKNGDRFGIDTSKKVILMGDSAGGNLSVTATYKLLEKGDVKVDGLALIYPTLYIQKTSTSAKKFGEDWILHTNSMKKVFISCYYPKFDSLSSIEYYVSPGLAPKELQKQLPPTFIVCGDRDPLLDDSTNFASQLSNLGISCTLQIEKNLTHGFMNLDLFIPRASGCLTLISKWINENTK